VTETASEPRSAGSPKADPETLVLRGVPRRVTRFRRGAIVAMAAVGSTAVVGVAWIALKPATRNPVAAGDESIIGAKALPDALAGAPATYRDVPQLGPPLPGDLGRPILDHQRELNTQIDPAEDAAAQAAQKAQAERQRIAAERLAARESGVMLELAGSASRTAAATPAATQPPASTARASSDAPSPERDLNGGQRNSAMLGRASDGADVNPHAFAAAPSPWTLQAGSIIAASLITGLDSDLPGLVTAQVTENVYDSVTGRALLIPQGSRLIGSYDSVVAFGQSRALVVWQRIILPDGTSVQIDNVPASDTQGYAGLSDRVDRHTWQLLKGVALSTLLGVGSQLSFGDSESDLVRAIRESAQQSGSRAGDQLVTKDLNVQPTLRVRPGWPLRVIVHKDIVFPHAWGGKRG
jgi:type IV secretion system protein VirB10